MESSFAVCRGPPAGKKAEVEITAAGTDKLKSGQVREKSMFPLNSFPSFVFFQVAFCVLETFCFDI